MSKAHTYDIKHLTMILGLAAVMLCNNTALAQIPGSVNEPAQGEVDTLPAIAQDQTAQFFTENPCPEPKSALQNTPNDLTKIQEDITRFNLCLQRAQLLSRLNDLALENLDTINSSIDKRIESVAGDMSSFEMPPMPTIPVPEIDEAQAREVERDIANEPPAPQTVSQPIEPEPIAQPITWKIDSIRGVNGSLVAKLVNADDMVANVTQGQKIPESDIVVVKVNQISVMVRQGKETHQLGWN